MNREILFRGKRLDTKQWVYGNYNNVNGKAYIFPEDAPDSYDNYQVDPDTVGQYTGLTDKNGSKIFEGDIIDFTNVDYPDCEIIFDNGSFVCNEIGEDNIVCDLRLGLVNEIIGNIFDSNLEENGSEK